MKQRNKKIPGDKPQWMATEAEDIENERNRRIGLRLVGRMTPGREYIVEKRGGGYSRNGKQFYETRYLQSASAGAENDKGAL